MWNLIDEKVYSWERWLIRKVNWHEQGDNASYEVAIVTENCANKRKQSNTVIRIGLFFHQHIWLFYNLFEESFNITNNLETSLH